MKTLTLITLAVLTLAATASAQERTAMRGDVGGQISGTSRSFGYSGASYGPTAHVVARSGRLGFEAQGGWSVAHKAQTHDGSRFDASASVRYYFGRVFIVGGAIVAHQRTSLYSKTGAGPQGGVGWDDGVNTLAFTVDKLLDENASVGYGGNYERLVRLSEHGYLSIRPFVTASTFGTPHEAVSRRESGVRAGISIGIGRKSQ